MFKIVFKYHRQLNLNTKKLTKEYIKVGTGKLSQVKYPFGEKTRKFISVNTIMIAWIVWICDECKDDN